MVWVPSNNNSINIDIQAKLATYNQVAFWQHIVQPEIKIENSHKHNRPDYKLNWLKEYTIIQKLKNTVPIKQEIDIIQGYSTHHNAWYPLSIILLRFPVTALNDLNSQSLYLGMLSTVPASLLRTWFGQSYPKLLGQASIRFVIQKSVNYKFQGFTGGHVIPPGLGLIHFFRVRCGFKQFDPNQNLPPDICNARLRLVRAQNDGRYYFSEDSGIIDAFKESRRDYVEQFKKAGAV